IDSHSKKIAYFLSGHPEVHHVYYPGLDSHPHREVHMKHASGFGGMISFTLKYEERARDVLNKVNYFTLAESLVASESLTSLPAKITHASIPRERRLEIGIEDGLIRISIALEDVADLIEDMDQALA